MLDLLWDPKFGSDVGVSEQGHLTQGEAVGGEPVGEHRLRMGREEKDFRQ